MIDKELDSLLDGDLNYLKMCQLMTNLGYVTAAIPERDLLYTMWSTLAEQQHPVTALNLKKFILAIEGICYDSLYRTSILPSAGSLFSPDGQLVLSNEDAIDIFMTYKTLYFNRIHSTKPSPVPVSPHTFSPQLC